MRRALSIVIVVFCLAAGLPAGMAGTTDVDRLTGRAQQLQLAEAADWHRLLHYSASARSASGIESQVIDRRFFLSAEGKTDPQAELFATIAALFGESGTTADENAELAANCRFVERERWLRERLDLPSVEVAAGCAEYHNWRKAVGSHSMSLVFPASYLNSPSSMFGHTLLRFDPANIDEDSEWLSWSLNFAADTGDENFSAGYAFKGITGGYAGKFHSVPYFTKLQEYGAIENRDIWEYKLDFTPEELDRLLNHAWELRDIAFDYYFFRQNCSFRLLELMDYARPSLALVSQYPLTTIPADTIKSVVDAGIVTDTHYRPSLGTGIQALYSRIDRSQRKWVRRIAKDPGVAGSASFVALPLRERARIVRIANDLVTYRSRRAARSPKMAEIRLQLLKLISQLPTQPATFERPPAPELAHETQLLGLRFGREREQNYTDINYRISYHDMLDRNTGYLRGAGIALGDVTFRRAEASDAVRLQSAELVKLQSISDRALIFNALSWNLSVGFKRDTHRNDNRLFGHFDGAIGKSTQVLPGTIGYAMLGGNVSQYSGGGERFVDLQAQIGALHYHRRFAARTELKLVSPQDETLRVTASVSGNIPLAKNHALRAEFARSRIARSWHSAASLQYRFYF